MTIFRPCIDLHAGSVKQIVGGTLSHHPPTSTSSSLSSDDDNNNNNDKGELPRQSEDGRVLKENFVSHLPAAYYAELYKKNGLRGGHVIKLGPGNDDAAREALRIWPGGLQVGGGVDDGNAASWVADGAEKVIITSFLFPAAKFDLTRLERVCKALGGERSRLVVDLSCRRVGEGWVVAMDKWTRLTDMEVNRESLSMLAPYCSEFLIHAADVEGLQSGIDGLLVTRLGEWSRDLDVSITYAGGGRSLEDLELVRSLSGGRVDLTIGSALDIFGGSGVKFGEVAEWNRRQSEGERGKLGSR
ncbi:MAG: Enzyme that catalyzes the fourth step in the histidine pathway [Bogoriella megaspora]|nr:MAG: Enzyme that catalyzes the fourth step in the histidine pathway [Bogoriella megaspora]